MAEQPDEDEEWVLLTEAATTGAGCTESWLIDRCRDGRLPSRPAPGSGLLVPITTVHALVTGRISE